MRTLITWLALTAVCAGCLCATDKTPVILDTDIGTDIDDAFALALVLSSPELDLRGVTTVSADAYGRALIACRMLESAGRAEVPVAAGRLARPQPEEKGQYAYGRGPGFSKRPVSELAPEFLYRKLKEDPGNLTLITIGDLTNVARLLTDHPEAKPWIKRIVIMGGAVRSGYNGKPPVVWEWNIRSDIKGAQTVFRSGVPLELAPLDATIVRLEAPMRDRIFSARTPLTDQLQALYRLWGKQTPVLFDPVAVTLSFNQSFFQTENLRIDVDDEGFTREVQGPPNARVAVSIRKPEFLDWYVDRIAGSRRVASFRADATPSLGEPLIWVTPTAKVEDPLWAKGVLIEDGGARYVLCTVDWCGLGGWAHRLFREKLAAAAKTDISRVVVQSVHQHAAPYVYGDVREVLAAHNRPVLLMSDRYLAEVTDRLAASLREATARLEPFDQIGTGEATVERVASARRIITDDGKLLTRFSGSGKDPLLASLPEGAIDPKIRVLTFARNGKPLVRLYSYATHPQTFCCDGRVSADIAGAARETMEREEGVFEIYFTGGAGDVTVGKYNDGKPEARDQLTQRLRDGMAAAAAATRFAPAGPIQWRVAELVLPPKATDEAEKVLKDPQPRTGEALYRAAMTAAFATAKAPLEASLLEIGDAAMVFLPGEPMLEFQNYALGLRPGHFTVFAGYGDISPGYLCTDQAYRQGGYEPSAANAAPGAEARIKAAIRSLLVR